MDQEPFQLRHHVNRAWKGERLQSLIIPSLHGDQVQPLSVMWQAMLTSVHDFRFARVVAIAEELHNLVQDALVLRMNQPFHIFQH